MNVRLAALEVAALGTEFLYYSVTNRKHPAYRKESARDLLAMYSRVIENHRASGA